MKRKMTENDKRSEYLTNTTRFDVVSTLSPKRTKFVEPNLVDVTALQAEKIEPGYLIKLAESIERANDIVLNSACGKLKMIENQMNYLKQQATKVLIETKINTVLNTLPCNFPKKIGSVYSVYLKPNGMFYFSMLSPEEWGSCPHKYIGTFRLEAATWMPMDTFSEQSAIKHWANIQNRELAMVE